MPTSRTLLLLLALLSLTPALHAVDKKAPAPPPAAPANAASLTDDQVVAAMNKAVDFLVKQQKSGHWEDLSKTWNENTTQRCGKTGLVVYALLNAGKSLGDEKLKPSKEILAPAIKYLQATTPENVYGVSLHATALGALSDSREITALLEKDRAYLLAAMLEHGIGYQYHHDKAEAVFKAARPPLVQLPASLPFNDKSDPSNTQFATLAAWSLADAGVEIPTTFWRHLNTYWRRKQHADGGWTYYEGSHKSGDLHPQAIAVAGLASMYILQDVGDTQVRSTPVVDRAQANALAYVTTHFTPNDKAFYYLYGIERVGRASGLKFFGATNWYKTVAANLINWQNPSGSWTSNGYWGEDETVATSFALLFLARGRNPVLFNKLQYNDPTWNTRPRDAANVTARLSSKFERPVNWQIVNLDVPVEEWLDAPVLLITGSKNPNFKDADLAKLKAFIDAGGIILSSADDSSGAFTEACRKAAQKLVDNRYEIREVPRDHPLYKLWSPVTPSARNWALSNGVRELWIHSIADLGAAWHGRRYANKEAYDFAGNLYFYVNGKGTMRPKLQTLAIADAPNANAKRFPLARLEYPGNWNPEPGAWPRFAKILRNEGKIDLAVQDVKVANLNPAATPIAHMTGTTRFALPDADKGQLLNFLTNGGILLADSAGGSPDFTAAFLDLMKDLYPNQPLQPLPADSPILDATALGGAKLATLDLRKFSREIANKPTGKLLALKNPAGRPIILFCDSDLTSGLLGTNTWGIDGLTPATAESLARNIALYAATK